MYTRGYIIWISNEDRILETSNIRFDEKVVFKEAMLDPNINNNFMHYKSDSCDESESDSEDLILCDSIAWFRNADR